MTTEQIQQQIYEVGSIAFLKQVHDALIQVAKHDPLSAHLANELEELIIFQDSSRENIGDTIDALMFKSAVR
jgi:hypothetical protein